MIQARGQVVIPAKHFVRSAAVPLGNGVTLTEPRKRIPGGRDRDHRRGGLWGVPTAQGATRTPRQRETAAAKDRP